MDRRTNRPRQRQLPGNGVQRAFDRVARVSKRETDGKGRNLDTATVARREIDRMRRPLPFGKALPHPPDAPGLGEGELSPDGWTYWTSKDCE
ncbi:MAG TPA: hypothetical protein VGY56_05235 [Verrucomicrobiae bacterium]|nr:hypothetical protein [Verrucomicrobiae bacterium]